jgi:GNAT superfamily N-acetyltransferase
MHQPALTFTCRKTVGIWIRTFLTAEFGMRIRTAATTDTPAMARIYVETWQSTYRGILPDAYLDAMTVADTSNTLGREMRAAGACVLVAESEGGQLRGLITGGIDRRRDCIYGGEIFSLYVREAYQRRGIGLGLVTRLAAYMNRLDIFTLKVQVLEANPCRRFYEKHNGVLLTCGRIRFADTDLSACTYGWLDTDLIGTVA